MGGRTRIMQHDVHTWLHKQNDTVTKEGLRSQKRWCSDNRACFLLGHLHQIYSPTHVTFTPPPAAKGPMATGTTVVILVRICPPSCQLGRSSAAVKTYRDEEWCEHRLTLVFPMSDALSMATTGPFSCALHVSRRQACRRQVGEKKDRMDAFRCCKRNTLNSESTLNTLLSKSKAVHPSIHCLIITA